MAAEIKIFKFGSITDGNATMKAELGGKGANLAEMSNLGIPVPPGFTIPCNVSVDYHSGNFNEKALLDEVGLGLAYLMSDEGVLPLVSVRSGARVSMPGMMDTILNVGLTTTTLPYWKSILGDRAALDSYRRLIQMYASVAMNVPMQEFEDELDLARGKAKVKEDHELTAAQLGELIDQYKEIVKQFTQKDFPDTTEEQIAGAILAVFKSWMNPRAIEYRKINSIPEDWGTAVTIQSMVFGNWNDNSATGVLFSRDPSTGANKITGEFLVNAQGEDVVAGIRTPEPLTKLKDWNAEVSGELVEVVYTLEKHYKDMQDIEFTVQDGKLYLLQTRSGKRSAKAAFKIAYDLIQEKMITVEEAKTRVTSKQLMALMQDTIDPSFKTAPDVVGIPAGGGLVTGVAVFTSEDAINCTEPCILVRKETDPDDIGGMHKSLGILTATGGLTSHAAVVARGMNKSCVVGTTELQIGGSSAFTPGQQNPLFKAGDKITIDGSTGKVWAGIDVPVIAGGASEEVKALLLMLKGDDVVERITITPDMCQSSQEINKAVNEATSTSIYIDTALIPTPSISGIMHSLGGVLKESPPFKSVVVDLSGLGGRYFATADHVLEFMFGIQEKHAIREAYVLNAVFDWDKSLQSTVHFKVGASASPTDVSGMKASGWKVLTVTKIQNFADLLEADGEIDVPADVIKKVFGDYNAWTEAKKMVEAASGKKFGGAKLNPKYWYEMSATGAGD